MKHAISPYLVPLIGFGPLFMTTSRVRQPDEPFLLSLMLLVIPYVGAAMLSFGAMLLLRAVQKQQKEIADLRGKVEGLTAR